MPNDNDPVVDEIREVRRRISERCGHDPGRLVAYYMELQKQYGDRLLRAEAPSRHQAVASTAPEAALTDQR